MAWSDPFQDFYNRPGGGAGAGPAAKPTVAQQTFNPRQVGGQIAPDSRTLGFAGGTSTPGAAPSMPFLGSQLAFQQTYGPAPLPQIVASMQQGGGAPKAPAGGPGAGAMTPVRGGIGGMQGAMAAKANSAMPGIFNGNTAPGSVRGQDPQAPMPRPAIGYVGPSTRQPAAAPAQPGYATHGAILPPDQSRGAQATAPTAPAPAPDAGPAAAQSTAALIESQMRSKAAASGGGDGSFSNLPDNQRQAIMGLPANERAARLRAWGYSQGADGKWTKPSAATPTTPTGQTPTPTPSPTPTPAPTPGPTDVPPAAAPPPANAKPGGNTTPVSTFDPTKPETYWNADGTPTWLGNTAQDDDRSFDDKFLGAKPDAWSTWSEQRKDEWRQQNYNPYGTEAEYFAQAPDDAAAEAFRRLFGDDYRASQNLPMPGEAGDLPEGAIPYTANLADFSTPGSPYYIQNPEIRAVFDNLKNYSTVLNQMQQTPDGIGSEKFRNTMAKYEAGRNVLQNLYGVTYDPFSQFVSGNNPGDTLDVADNTSIQTRIPSGPIVTDELLGFFKGAGENAKQYALEFATQKWLAEQGLQRQQQGINLLQPVVDQTLRDNNEMRRLSEDQMLAALKDPDPVDWQGIRNRATSDQAGTLRQSLAAASAGGARRGVSPGSMSGLAGQLTAESGNSLSRRLGELTTQEQIAGRQSLYDALNQAANVSRQWQGAESQARQTLANAVAGQFGTPSNPYAGISDTRLGLEQLLLSQKQAENAAQDDSALWGAGIGAAGMIGAAAI